MAGDVIEFHAMAKSEREQRKKNSLMVLKACRSDTQRHWALPPVSQPANRMKEAILRLR